MVTTTRATLISFTVFVFGRSTSMPDCSTGAVIMKIIRSTSTTSTSGTMLISASDVSVCLESWGMARGQLVINGFNHGQKLHREVIHAGGGAANLAQELVIKDDR